MTPRRVTSRRMTGWLLLGALCLTWTAPLSAASTGERPRAGLRLPTEPSDGAATPVGPVAALEDRGFALGREASGISTLPIILSAAGLAAGLGLAVYLKNDADDHFDRYLRTADQAEASALFRSAERRDRASLIGWVIAQVSLVTLFYSVIRNRERPRVSTNGEAYVVPIPHGVAVGIRVAP